MYVMTRESDNQGESGPESIAIGLHGIHHDSRPTEGMAHYVGSTSRWWRTSMILEILEDLGNKVRFRTMNSIYTWEKL